MTDGGVITLAGVDYNIRPLPLRVVKKLNGLLTSPAVGEDASFDRLVETLSEGLSSNYPDLTPDVLYGLAISYSELVAAVRKVHEVSGFRVVTAGESAAPSTGSMSTGG